MNKIKLTDLSHLQPLDEKMSHIKGGDDPEQGPLCWGCKCTCQCSNNNTADTTATNNQNSGRNNGGSSWGIDVGIAVLVGIGARLL